MATLGNVAYYRNGKPVYTSSVACVEHDQAGCEIAQAELAADREERIKGYRHDVRRRRSLRFIGERMAKAS